MNSAADSGFYALQAAIVACHANAATPDATDWPRIAGLYAELAALVRSPIIELNRAVAVGMAEGPAAALAIVDGLAHEPALKNYHLLESVRGDLLCKLGRFAEARAAFEIASRLRPTSVNTNCCDGGPPRRTRTAQGRFTSGTDRFRGRWAPRPELLHGPAALQSCS